ncbi:MAG: Rpn family recombination-promoting nuclease/putative transposase [Bacteroidales bacterium]|nr:Rpn family recombination-promoting nuclease/putative transposase [Bacteroidales bacterium]
MNNNILYIDPMVDFGFKKIFKESGHKQLIIRPLNAIFGLDIADIDIRESEQLGLTDQERKATFDMHCETKDGLSFIIEVQLADQPYFMERAIFYTSRTITHKAQTGEWNYDLKPIFFLGLLNFDIRHLEPEKADPLRFIHKFSLREDETHEQMSQALRFAFMEVARFNKTKDECETFEERFLWIMKNLPTFAEEPELWDDPYFKDFMEQAEFANMSWEEQERYIASMKQKWDYKNSIDFAEQKGREEERQENARNLKSLGVAIDTIAQALGLSVDEVQAL